jgi:hypothetical protein
MSRTEFDRFGVRRFSGALVFVFLKKKRKTKSSVKAEHSK